jgi:hypothetical protein
MVVAYNIYVTIFTGTVTAMDSILKALFNKNIRVCGTTHSIHGLAKN